MIARKLLFRQLNQKIQKILEMDDEVQVEEIHEVVVQVDEAVLEGDHQVDEEAHDDEDDEYHFQKIIVLCETFLLVIMMGSVLML
jgi:hypothetical protein